MSGRRRLHGEAGFTAMGLITVLLISSSVLVAAIGAFVQLARTASALLFVTAGWLKFRGLEQRS